MNNELKKKNRLSKMSKKLVIEYYIAVAGFITASVFIFILGYGITSMVIWQPYDPIYIVLRFILDYILFFGGIYFIGGWTIITYVFLSKPLRYLDEIVTASEKLALLTPEPIILSHALIDTEHELNRVREKALSAAKTAKDAEQRKNDLVVYLAHDLKTPLTSVIGYLTLLRDEGQISEELRNKYLSISLDKAERLEDLINEFFEITRFNLSDITLEYSRVNLTRMLEQLIFEFKPMLMDKNLQCRLSAAADTMIKCDVNKLQRVFDNLLRNAVFYSFEDSTIEITVLQNEREISISFVNHGNTIPDEKLERIFEQFYRLDTSRGSNNGGAGLGLAISKEIVELHQGNITARSENEMIEFLVVIPSVILAS